MYVYIYIYNPLNNFCGLSLDKTDHVVQNRTMDIRRYTPVRFDIRRPILFRRKENQETRKRSSLTFNWSTKTKKDFWQKPVRDIQKAG